MIGVPQLFEPPREQRQWQANSPPQATPQPVKRGRGRPRKHPLPDVKNAQRKSKTHIRRGPDEEIDLDAGWVDPWTESFEAQNASGAGWQKSSYDEDAVSQVDAPGVWGPSASGDQTPNTTASLHQPDSSSMPLPPSMQDGSPVIDSASKQWTAVDRLVPLVDQSNNPLPTWHVDKSLAVASAHTLYSMTGVIGSALGAPGASDLPASTNTTSSADQSLVGSSLVGLPEV